MEDKELLELAAKAAGIEIELCHFGSSKSFFIIEDGRLEEQWNPLKHNGDALRLAVKLKLIVDIGCGYTEARDPEHEQGQKPITAMEYFFDEDPYAATRRAIVRAAAEIGRGME